MTQPELEHAVAEIASVFAKYVRAQTALAEQMDAALAELQLEIQALKFSKDFDGFGDRS